MRSNITTVTWEAGSFTGHGADLWQWDYGHQLKLEGPDLNLPERQEVHLAPAYRGEALKRIAVNGIVTLDDEIMEHAGVLKIFIYKHTGADDGETDRKASLLIQGREKPKDYDPAPVQQDVISETIAAANSALERAEAAAEGLEGALALFDSLGLSVADGELCQTYEEG